MSDKIVVQNEPTPLETSDVEFAEECAEVCREATVNIFKRIVEWNPVKAAAELAGQMLLAKADNAMPLFGEECSLTERQQDYIKSHVLAVFMEAASVSLTKIKNYERESEDFIAKAVIREMIKVPEKTMAAIGQSINRGALLAMTAVQGKATSEERDEILMWKSKHSGDITIPTRGVFISTNCVEKIKGDINFRGVGDVTTEVL